MKDRLIQRIEVFEWLRRKYVCDISNRQLTPDRLRV